MSINQDSLTDDDAALVLLYECGSFWPDSMVDKGSFMKMLVRALNVEAHDIQSERWEEELTLSGACNASGVVDVKHFVTFCLEGGVERAKTVVGELFTIQEGDERLAATSSIASQGAHNGIIIDPDRSLSISSLLTAVIGEQMPLPSPEDQAGAVVVVDSKQYVLGERLGHGAGGSVFAATLKREAADVHAVGDAGSDSHDLDSQALKLVGGVGNAEFRGADTRLAAVAVEAVAAAELHRMAQNEVVRWEGRVFLPVLHAVGRVEAVGDKQVQNMSAL
eukprot:738333-Amphidinium_carterae.1